MKYIITESQLNEKIYDKFLDMLVDRTTIFGGRRHKYDKFKYVAHIKYPYSDNPYDLAFNTSEEYTFTSPGRYNLKNWFEFVGVDMDKDYKLAESLWKIYLDKVQEKVKLYIDDFFSE